MLGRDDGGRGRQDVAVLVVLNGLVDHDWKHGVPGQAEGFEFIRIRAAFLGRLDVAVRCWPPTAHLPDEGEVVHARDAEHGVVDAVTFEATVAEDLPGLHPGEDVLDSGADLLVGLVVGFLPAGQSFALAPPAGHDKSGTGTATVGDCGDLAQTQRLDPDVRRHRPLP
jgi:hypothetical protein